MGVWLCLYILRLRLCPARIARKYYGVSSSCERRCLIIILVQFLVLRTFAPIVSAHPYCARNSLRDAMPRHALSARAVEEMRRYLTIILRNRAEYHLILSRRGRRPSWLNQEIFRKIEQYNCFIIQQILIDYHFHNEKNYRSMMKTLKASNT